MVFFKFPLVMFSVKQFVFKFSAVSFGLMVVFALLEVVLRVLPVSTPTYSNPINSSHPISNFKPNNEVISSKGWNFEFVSHKRTNNYGFFSDVKYRKQSNFPLMAVIGDSFVEAKQVDNAESMHGLLNNEVRQFGRVYGFGVSGAPLSQYLAFAGFAREEFSPDSYVFIIIGNDFAESFRKYTDYQGFHYFVEKNGQFFLERIDDRKEHPMLVRIFRESAVFMYLFSNLQLNWKTANRLVNKVAFWRDDSVRQKKPEEYFANVPHTVSQETENESYVAIDTFFSLLPEKTGKVPANILFVVDGMRQAIYSDASGKGSYFFKMRTYFIWKAERLGYEVIDMHPVFQNDYLKKGEKFEYSIDFHWNELGHCLVAQEIANSKTFKKTFNVNVQIKPRPKGRRY